MVELEALLFVAPSWISSWRRSSAATGLNLDLTFTLTLNLILTLILTLTLTLTLILTLTLTFTLGLTLTLVLVTLGELLFAGLTEGEVQHKIWYWTWRKRIGKLALFCRKSILLRATEQEIQNVLLAQVVRFEKSIFAWVYLCYWPLKFVSVAFLMQTTWCSQGNLAFVFS